MFLKISCKFEMTQKQYQDEKNMVDDGRCSFSRRKHGIDRKRVDQQKCNVERLE